MIYNLCRMFSQPYRQYKIIMVVLSIVFYITSIFSLLDIVVSHSSAFEILFSFGFICQLSQD